MRILKAVSAFFRVGSSAAWLTYKQGTKQPIITLVVPEKLLPAFYLGCLDNYRRYEPREHAYDTPFQFSSITASRGGKN